MSTEQFYRFLYLVVWPFFNLFHPVRTVGREHIPEGAAVICPNHTALSDPFFVAFAFQKKNPLRVMAKIQLMRVPVIGWLRARRASSEWTGAMRTCTRPRRLCAA